MPLSCENPQIATCSEKEQKIFSATYMKEKILLLEDEGHRLLTILPLEGQRAGEHFKLGGKEKKGRSRLRVAQIPLHLHPGARQSWGTACEGSTA